MDITTHKIAAEMHYTIANTHDSGFLKAESAERKAYMAVAAQNYFYCVVNLVEMIFARANEHSFNHENRYRKITEKSTLFSAEFKKMFDEVDRDLRNKVAYKGENGKKYAKIKQLADLAMKELNPSFQQT